MNLFRDSYESLHALPSLTKVDSSGKNHFFLIQNGTAHNTMPLQEPEYAPQYEVDNTEFDKTHTDRFTCDGKTLAMEPRTRYKLTHYQCNMAAWLQLGRWMDHLKEIGVYDNTRIIIVSDHGWPLEHYEDMLFLDGANAGAEYNPEDAMAYNPVLFVKDFGATGFTTDESFMTNADVPALATDGIINNPVNPFTGNPLSMDHDGPMFVLDSNDWSRAGADSYRYAEDDWYVFDGDTILDADAWEFDGTR